MLQVEVVSPEKILFSGEARMVIARTSAGDIAFETGHVPFIGNLEIHPVRVIFEGGKEQVVAVHKGFVECAYDRVTILSDLAELADEIDVPRAEAALARAESALGHATEPDLRLAEAMRRAQVRIEAAAGA
ncbi:MAG: ATP synthase F1 subunit epsilon [Acidimicrobiia bacterium]